MKLLLILVFSICQVLPTRGDGDWFQQNEEYGCNDTHYYREGLYGVCFEEPYIVDVCPKCSNIELSLDQVYIIDIDLKKQILTTKFNYTITWYDYRLVHHSFEDFGYYSPVESVLATYMMNEFWMPILHIHQAIDSKMQDGLGLAEKLMFKHQQMIYTKIATFEITCQMNFQDFPFDEQICFMKFGSWTYDQAQVDIVNK